MIPADAAEEEIASAQAEMVAAEEIAPPLLANHVLKKIIQSQDSALTISRFNLTNKNHHTGNYI